MKVDVFHVKAVDTLNVIDMSYKFFENTLCQYHPCHTYPKKDFNCLFCYCPLYPYEDCGGNYEMLGNIKDCTNCYLPHKSESYNYIIEKLIELNVNKA